MGIYSIALEISCHWNWNVGIISYFIIRIIRRRVNAEQNKNQIQYESRHQESMVMENDIKSTLPWQCYVRIWIFSWSNFLLYTRRDFFSFRIGDRIFFLRHFLWNMIRCFSSHWADKRLLLLDPISRFSFSTLRVQRGGAQKTAKIQQDYFDVDWLKWQPRVDFR